MVLLFRIKTATPRPISVTIMIRAANPCCQLLLEDSYHEGNEVGLGLGGNTAHESSEEAESSSEDHGDEDLLVEAQDLEKVVRLTLCAEVKDHYA